MYIHTEVLLKRTCAGDDNVHLSDDLVQFDQSEAIHAERLRENNKQKWADDHHIYGNEMGNSFIKPILHLLYNK